MNCAEKPSLPSYKALCKLIHLYSDLAEILADLYGITIGDADKIPETYSFASFDESPNTKIISELLQAYFLEAYKFNDYRSLQRMHDFFSAFGYKYPEHIVSYMYDPLAIPSAINELMNQPIPINPALPPQITTPAEIFYMPDVKMIAQLNGNKGPTELVIRNSLEEKFEQLLKEIQNTTQTYKIFRPEVLQQIIQKKDLQKKIQTLSIYIDARPHISLFLSMLLQQIVFGKTLAQILHDRIVLIAAKQPLINRPELFFSPTTISTSALTKDHINPAIQNINTITAFFSASDKYIAALFKGETPERIATTVAETPKKNQPKFNTLLDDFQKLLPTQIDPKIITNTHLESIQNIKIELSKLKVPSGDEFIDWIINKTIQTCQRSQIILQDIVLQFGEIQSNSESEKEQIQPIKINFDSAELEPDQPCQRM